MWPAAAAGGVVAAAFAGALSFACHHHHHHHQQSSTLVLTTVAAGAAALAAVLLLLRNPPTIPPPPSHPPSHPPPAAHRQAAHALLSRLFALAVPHPTAVQAACGAARADPRVDLLVAAMRTDPAVTDVHIFGSVDRLTSLIPVKDVDIGVVFARPAMAAELAALQHRHAGDAPAALSGLDSLDDVSVLQLFFHHIRDRLAAGAPTTTRDHLGRLVAEIGGAQPMVLRQQAVSIGVCMGAAWDDTDLTFDLVPLMEPTGAEVRAEETAETDEILGQPQLLVFPFGHPPTPTPVAGMRQRVSAADSAWDGRLRQAVGVLKRWNGAAAVKGSDARSGASSLHKLVSSFVLEHGALRLAEGLQRNARISSDALASAHDHVEPSARQPVPAPHLYCLVREVLARLLPAYPRHSAAVRQLLTRLEAAAEAGEATTLAALLAEFLGDAAPSAEVVAATIAQQEKEEVEGGEQPTSPPPTSTPPCWFCEVPLEHKQFTSSAWLQSAAVTALIAEDMGQAALAAYLAGLEAEERQALVTETLVELAGAPQHPLGAKYIALLLDLGGSPTARNRQHIHALHAAVGRGNLAALEVLDPAPPQSADDSRVAATADSHDDLLMFAIKAGQADVAAWLLARGWPVNNLHVAALATADRSGLHAAEDKWAALVGYAVAQRGVDPCALEAEQHGAAGIVLRWSVLAKFLARLAPAARINALLAQPAVQAAINSPCYKTAARELTPLQLALERGTRRSVGLVLATPGVAASWAHLGAFLGRKDVLPQHRHLMSLETPDDDALDTLGTVLLFVHLCDNIPLDDPTRAVLRWNAIKQQGFLKV